MKTALASLKLLLADPLFVRVCMVVWGTPFLVLGLVAVPQIHPSDAGGWFALCVLVSLGLYGTYLVLVGVLGSARLVVRSSSFMSEGGEVLGALFAVVVGIVAIPVTLGLRAILRRGRA
jgi:hypothetical protein